MNTSRSCLRITVFLLASVLALISCDPSGTRAVSELKILPKPLSLERMEGYFTLDQGTLISAPEELHSTAGLFADQIKAIVSIEPAVSVQGKGISLKLDTSIQGDEAYHLEVSPDKVRITARTEAGIFYGTQSFLQLLPSEASPGASIRIPCVAIHDQPRFSWRGMMLDESRHFFGAELVKTLIDQMARVKMNVFHWHLVDDQGWRIEIKKHPRLTEIGAWRLDNENGVWNYSVQKPEDGDPGYGGFYTQDEIREILEYAEARQVRIVPEIEMPGHATAMIWAYPELSCKEALWEIGEGKGFEFSDPLCAGNERSFEILEDVLSEVIDLFPSTYIHIGGDECKKEAWSSCPRCRERMEEEQLDDLHALQSYFISRMESFVRSKGRYIIGWDEILEGGLAHEAAVMSWRGFAGGIAAAEMGHAVVMSPTSHCYFDYYQGESSMEPKAIGGFLPLSKVYQFDPVPRGLSKDRHRFIMGGQANLWTEHIFTPGHAEYMTFPRLFAMAEVLWTQKEQQDYTDFLSRLEPRYASLASMKVNFRMPTATGLSDEVLFSKDTSIILFNPFGEDEVSIRYTLDGSEPDRNSLSYEGPILITEDLCLRTKVFYRDFESYASATRFYSFDPEHNGLSCAYYEGDWDMLPDFSKLSPLEEYPVTRLEANTRSGLEDHYALRFSGYYDVKEAGDHEFYTSSDDGTRLLINGQRIIDNDGLHGAETVTGTIFLEAGRQHIELQYFEATGGEYLEAGLISEQGAKESFRPSELFFEKGNKE